MSRKPTGRKEPLQVLLSQDEKALLTEAATRSGMPLARRAALVLLAWANEGLNVRGGVRGGKCGSSDGCTSGDAEWYNRNSKIFVCVTCAARSNQNVSGICELGGGPNPMRKEEVERLQVAIAKRPTKIELMDALVKAAKALADCDVEFPPPGWNPHPTAPGWFYKGELVKSEADLRKS